MFKVRNQFREIPALQDADRDIVFGAQEGSDFPGCMVVVDSQSAFVRGKATNGTSAILLLKHLLVFFYSKTVGMFQFGATRILTAFIRPVVSLIVRFSRRAFTVFCHIGTALFSLVFGQHDYRLQPFSYGCQAVTP